MIFNRINDYKYEYRHNRGVIYALEYGDIGLLARGKCWRLWEKRTNCNRELVACFVIETDGNGCEKRYSLGSRVWSGEEVFKEAEANVKRLVKLADTKNKNIGADIIITALIKEKKSAEQIIGNIYKEITSEDEEKGKIALNEHYGVLMRCEGAVEVIERIFSQIGVDSSV